MQQKTDFGRFFVLKGNSGLPPSIRNSVRPSGLIWVNIPAARFCNDFKYNRNIHQAGLNHDATPPQTFRYTRPVAVWLSVSVRIGMGRNHRADGSADAGLAAEPGRQPRIGRPL
jgi:hypothetical protein